MRALVFLLLTANAHASPRYDAPPNCPVAEKAWAYFTGDAPDIIIKERDAQFVGVATWSDTKRVVDGASCSDVLQTIALVARLRMQDRLADVVEIEPSQRLARLSLALGGQFGRTSDYAYAFRGSFTYGDRWRITGSFGYEGHEHSAHMTSMALFDAELAFGAAFASSRHRITLDVGYNAGVLRARKADSRSQLRPWRAFIARAQFVYFLQSSLSVGVSAGVGVALTRDRFLVADGSVVYQPRQISQDYALTVGLHF